MENNRFEHTQVEAAIQYAIRIGWKPEARLGEQAGDINISFVEISGEKIYSDMHQNISPISESSLMMLYAEL